MADSPLEVKPDRDTTVDAVCDLIKGATLLKAGRSGRPHFRQFRLSSDLTKLMWESPKKTDAAVLISQITGMKLGQTTPNFKRNPVPLCEALSFSLLYSDRSLDIVCKDKREFEIWTSGIKALMENCVDKKLVENRLKEAGQNTSEDKLIVQMGSTLKRFGTTVKFKEDSCHLYLWGGGSRGKLGHKEDEKEMWPRVVEALLEKNITMVACGTAHTMALSSKGMVFAWGAGANGQLGHGNLRDRYSPLMVDKPLRGLEVVHISCYEYHSAALSAEGKVFTWGKAGPYLGYSLDDGSTKQLVPRQVEILAKEKIIHLACGRLHTLACADSGQVFSFGVNKFGELGLGHDKETTKPVLIPEMQSAYRVACGRHHSAAIDEDGVLWMWGWGGRGQLGNSTMKSQFQPVVPEGFNEHTVEDVSCGYGHTGAITANGIAYCWGDNSAGQVGVPNTAYGEITQPRPLVTPTGTRPKQISCGANYTAIITNGGKMFTWGCGAAGQLGHGNVHKSVCQLMEVDALVDKNVVAAASGEEHMGCLVVHAWVPDDEARSCMACRKPFTTVRRRHHCRNCGGIYCNSCSSKKFPLLEKGHSDPVRVCDRCFDKLAKQINPAD